MNKLFQGILAAFAVSFVLVGFTGTAVAGHPAAECKQYATNAVNQFNSLKAAGCQGKPGDDLWSDYYQGHYNWCLNTKADINQQFKMRRIAIEKCQARTDAACHAYANDAVSQVNAFVKKGCLLVDGNPSLWGTNPQDHYNWCRANVGADLNQQHKLRRMATENCQTAASYGSGGSGSISVTPVAGGKNQFSVTGSGFLPNRQIHIRVTGAALGGSSIASRDFSSTSDASGKFHAVVSGACATKGVLLFVATDSTDLSRAAWTRPPYAAGC